MLWFLALRVTFQRERGLSLSFKAHCPGVFAAGSCWATGNVELAYGGVVGWGDVGGVGYHTLASCADTHRSQSQMLQMGPLLICMTVPKDVQKLGAVSLKQCCPRLDTVNS